MRVAIWEVVRNLGCVKLKEEHRAFVNQAKKVLQSKGSLPPSTCDQLRSLASRYHAKIKELLEARERARHTNGIRASNRTRQEVENGCRLREEERRLQKADLGF